MEKHPCWKIPLSILFQFCDIVQECINKILWLTFLFPAINIFSCLSLFSDSCFHTYFKLGNHMNKPLTSLLKAHILAHKWRCSWQTFINSLSSFKSLSCVWVFCDPMHCSPPGTSVHRISQERVLEQVDHFLLRGSFLPKYQTHISYTGSWILYPWATREAHILTQRC